MLHDPLDNAVVGISALVVAFESFPALVSGDSQRDSILGAEFLQLGHYAGCYYGRGFGVQEVHEGLVKLELCVDGVREEVGVDEDRVGRPQGSVGLEEEGRGDLGTGRVLAVGRVGVCLQDHCRCVQGVHFSLCLGFFFFLLCFCLSRHLVFLSTWPCQRNGGRGAGRRVAYSLASRWPGGVSNAHADGKRRTDEPLHLAKLAGSLLDAHDCSGTGTRARQLFGGVNGHAKISTHAERRRLAGPGIAPAAA